MAAIPVDLAARDLNAWVTFLRTAEIPVLKQTAREIGRNLFENCRNPCT